MKYLVKIVLGLIVCLLFFYLGINNQVSARLSRGSKNRLPCLIRKSEKLQKEILELEKKLDSLLKKKRGRQEGYKKGKGLSIINIKDSSLDVSQKRSLELFQKGYDLAKQGDYLSAIDYFYDALKYSSKFAGGIYYDLGYIYVKLGEYEKGISCFHKALNFKEDKDIYYNLAIIYTNYLKDFSKAEKFYKKYLSFR